MGKEKFQRMLADTEMVTTPVDQLEQIGRADLAANQNLLGEACALAVICAARPGEAGELPEVGVKEPGKPDALALPAFAADIDDALELVDFVLSCRAMGRGAERTTKRLPSCSNARVVGSSVSNRRSSTLTSAPVSAFKSVDLPAFV